MINQDRIRFCNESVFAEADPPKDRKKPLEWRRSFNSLRLTARQPFVSYSFDVNECDTLSVSPDANSESSPQIKPNLNRKIEITARIEDDDCRDTVHHAVEIEKGSGLFHLHTPAGAMRLSIVSREPTKARLVYSEGAYVGSAFIIDDFPGEQEHLYIQVSAPLKVVEELAAQLSKRPSLGLSVQLVLRSFSYEVDDALREWYHSRDLFIHRTVPAALLDVAIVPRGHGSEKSMDDAPTSPETVHSAIQVTSNAHDSSIQHSQSLRGIKVALWAIAIVLALQLLAT